MALLNFENIKNADDLPSKVINIPEWGGDIKIRILSLGERLELDEEFENKKEIDILVKWIAKCCVDDNNNPVFTTEEQIKVLTQKNGDVIMRIFKEIKHLSNLDVTTTVDSLAKN